ncbi:MAG TPA: UDP-glucose 4-epimerase GalE [Ktedonobacteraceae bacterium]
MRVLVTGGSGYVGSHAARELSAAGHEIRIFDNLSTGHPYLSRGFSLIQGDICDMEKLSRSLRDMDAVMHFAASAYVDESVVNPRKYIRNNVESAVRLLDAVLASPVRLFVFSSTCAVYGIPSKLPICEDAPKEPINLYGATKLFFESVLSAYSVSHGLRYVALRYFNAAGAHPDGSIGEMHAPETHLIPLALSAVLGSGPPLQVFGSNFDTPDGTCIRDFIHVCDLAAAHVRALEYLQNGGESISLNLGAGRGISVAEVLAAIKCVTGSEVPHVITNARPGDPPVLYADPSMSRHALGWQAKRPFDEIVSSAWLWAQHLQSLNVQQ